MTYPADKDKPINLVWTAACKKLIEKGTTGFTVPVEALETVTNRIELSH